MISAKNLPDRDADDVDKKVLIEISNVTKVYGTGPTAVHALGGVDLKLFSGELVVMLGPSGSGKSTLLNIMGGLDRVTEGKVLFGGRNLTQCDDGELTQFRRRHVGFVFQFYNLVPSLTARENVALVTEIAERPMTPDKALALVGLEQRMNHFPAELSGGEQQRVAIARAIAKQPELLLCDEPTGALDLKTGVKVLKAITAINDELGTTTALITHNAGIRAIADRVIHFRDGLITEVAINDERVNPADVSW